MNTRLLALVLLVSGAALIAAGCERETVTSPEPSLEGPPAAAGKTVSNKIASEKDVTSISPVRVHPTVDPSTPVLGYSRLSRTRRGATATLRTTGLTAGEPVSFWWVVFNHPEKCATQPCSAADVRNPEVMADMLGTPGQVIGQAGSAHLGGHLRVGDTSNSYVFQNFGMPPVGLLDAMGAEFHLVIRSHGPTIPGQVDEQISTFNGGCPPNTCGNVRFSLHLP